MKVGDIEVHVEGEGPASVVMIHGWPDTHRLWDASIEALGDRYRCVRFDLPGFGPAQSCRAYAIDEVIESIHRMVVEACPGERVCLLLHDWGCYFGYKFAMRYPHLVARVIGVDIGDAGSVDHRRELGLPGIAAVVAYQVWLALAWRIGGRIGDAMARGMARVLHCPGDFRTVTAQMGYPYAVSWLGVAGGSHDRRVFRPHCPMLYVYGGHKPFMLHSTRWIEAIAALPGSRALGLPGGHWVMIDCRRGFHDALRSWLAATDTSPA